MSTKYIYLIQGKAELVKVFFELHNRPSSRAIFLTYDQELNGAIYFPKSTWSQGRNRLLDEAKKMGSAEYYIFLDDDIQFIKGSFDSFEKCLEKWNPSVGFPVFHPKTIDTPLSINSHFNGKPWIQLEKQVCVFADASFMAIHRDVISDGIVVPLLEKFDDVSWWFTSSTQQLLIFNLYQNTVLQFNKIVIADSLHRNYPKNSYLQAQKDWLNRQFKRPFKDERKLMRNIFSVAILSKLLKESIQFRNGKALYSFLTCLKVLKLSLTYKIRNTHKLSESDLRSVIRKDSELFLIYESANKPKAHEI